MKYGFRKELVAAAVAIPFALVAGGCSGGGDSEQDPASIPTDTIVEAPAPGPEVEPDTVVVDTVTEAAAETPAPTTTPATQVASQPAAPRGRTTADGIYTMAQATRGENTFANICSTCHNATDFVGSHFTHNWGSRSVGDIHEFISGNMPMDAPGSLTAQEYTDIVAFFIRQNGYPAGQTELPASTEALKQIRFAPALAAGD